MYLSFICVKLKKRGINLFIRNLKLKDELSLKKKKKRKRILTYTHQLGWNFEVAKLRL